MKQPELGRKIADLRKAKGLTQEELVEQCKLNVRTLQRIEAGEVTPRSYTLRTIFAALDFNVAASLDDQNVEPRSPGFDVPAWLEQAYLYVVDLFNLKTNTMKKISILSVASLSVIFSLMTIFSEAQTKADLKDVVVQTNKNFTAWFNSGQIDQLVGLYDNDACLEGRGCGKAFIKDYYAAESSKYKIHELTSTDVSIKDNVGTETGTWTFKLPNGMLMSGKYSCEWKLVKDKWLIVNDKALIEE